MNTKDRNFYQTGRLAAGLTQERAAECLGISVRSLSIYESGERIPPDFIAIAMADVYGCQWLVYQHCRANVEAAQQLLPEITLETIPVAVLKLHTEVTEFLTMREELLAIASDGVIDATEKPRFERIISQLDDIRAAILSLKYAEEEAEHGQAVGQG